MAFEWTYRGTLVGVQFLIFKHLLLAPCFFFWKAAARYVLRLCGVSLTLFAHDASRVVPDATLSKASLSKKCGVCSARWKSFELINSYLIYRL
jgi:hypothetical protein